MPGTIINRPTQSPEEVEMSPCAEELFATAKKYIPGGVNSPVRAFNSVGGTPVFMERASGAYLYDNEGKEYIDYVGSWGPMILGHNAPTVIAALTAQLAKGVSFGTATAAEITIAKKITELMPAIEQVRLVNSGTEATMSAIRLARAHTGKDKLIKFAGCYHGHSDGLLVDAGSGALTFGAPSSPGVPKSITEHTLSAEFNNLASVEALFAANPHNIAAIIVEPIAGNMNLIKPAHNFLQGLRDLCTKHQAVLIFDEVMTGFRVALGGAQELYNITPDLTTLGKIIGGGLPVGAFGGKAEIMSKLSPSGQVYQAGTLSGNPLAVAAGLATLEAITRAGFYQELAQHTAMLCQGLSELAQEANVPWQAHSIGGMFGFFFTAQASVPESFTQVMQCNSKAFNIFFHAMLSQGIYLAPSMYEAGFVSSCHDQATLDKTLQAARVAFAQVKEQI